MKMDNIILHYHDYLHRTNEWINDDQLSYNSEEDIFLILRISKEYELKTKIKE
jgi:hypothetical protein